MGITRTLLPTVSRFNVISLIQTTFIVFYFIHLFIFLLILQKLLRIIEEEICLDIFLFLSLSLSFFFFLFLFNNFKHRFIIPVYL